MAMQHIVLMSLGGEAIGERDAPFSESLSQLKVELGLEAHHRLILGGKILADETLTGELEMQVDGGELPEMLCLQVVVPAPCLAPNARPGCTFQEDRLGVSSTSPYENVYLDQKLFRGSHVITFRVVNAGSDGFAVGIVHECVKHKYDTDQQPGSREQSWGWTAYDGRQSSISSAGGGWRQFSEQWNSPGTEVKMLLDCDTGSVFTAIGSASMQEAFVCAEWAAAPLFICWHLTLGSQIDSISVRAAQAHECPEQMHMKASAGESALRNGTEVKTALHCDPT
mmetsp:Transcript_86992/g.218958  ORF Transcript_86992/g.218958 Transcript_86992/m.218958 type:complete len:282 (+) Transcript_86992:95-940(+)